MKDNPVAKNAHKFNKSAVHKDRKKAQKRGDRKHKGKAYEEVEEGRNYKKEYENYHSSPEQKKRRAARNGARRLLKNRKNIEGKDVHHKDNNPLNNDKSNLSIVTQHYNRKEPRMRKEALGADATAKDYIDDFQKSDAPQFKGKSAEKRKEMAIAAYLDAKRGQKNEDLRKWFGKGKEGDWVRVGTDGEIKGDCARDEGEGKPKCMPRSKAHGMEKKDRASAARRKRAKDPSIDRPGTGNKPIMVKTKKESALPPHLQKILDKKGNIKKGKVSIKGRPSSSKSKVTDVKVPGYTSRESVEEKNTPTNPKLWAKFKAQAKSKFDVYPSAYANGWAAKQYKAAGGGWKTVKEDSRNTPGDGNPCWDTHKKVGTKMKNGKRVNNCVPKNESAQDRLNNRAAKHGLGQPNKAADSYMGKMKAKHGEKGVADMKAAGQAKIDAWRKAQQQKEGVELQERPEGVGGTTYTSHSMRKKAMQNPKVAKRVADVQKREKQRKAGMSFMQKRALKKQQSAGQRKRYQSNNDRADDANRKAGFIESMDPRDFTDKAGYLVTAKVRGKEEIKNFFHTKPSAEKYANRVNQGGNKATIYKTNGRNMVKEEHLSELTKREMEMLAKRKQSNLVKRGKAKPEPKKTGSAGRTYNVGAGKDESDDNVIIQLRKAQDMRGNHQIKFQGGQTKLPPKMIDKLLNTYDRLGKPADKKRFVTLVTHELRKKEGVGKGNTGKKSADPTSKLGKMKMRKPDRRKGPRTSGPTNKELQDIERGK